MKNLLFGGMIALAVSLAGCQLEQHRSAPEALANHAPAVDLDAVMNKQNCVIVFVIESGRGVADDEAGALPNDSAVKNAHGHLALVLLDLGISRNRATAARFHLTDTPMLVCLTPGGVIVSRDEKPITRELVLKRIDEAVQRAPALDARLAALEKATEIESFDATAKLNLADFLLAQQNAREAIAPLASVAHSGPVEPAVRVRAWVALARAHLWIGEPEKGRHEARGMMATLGPKTPEALAGGNLVLGLQDAKAKRVALARREFADAMAAAPDSVYAKQAADALATLPTGGQ